MKISEVSIRNFRGIKEVSIKLRDYTLLVGPNNAGKSTVIDALRAFYEKDKFVFNKNTDTPFIQTVDNESWIEILFELTDDEHNSLADEYQSPNRTLRVRKFFRANDPKKNGCIYGYTSEGLCDNQFYGEKNVQKGKFGEVIYIPAVSKVDDHTKLSGPSALRDLLSSILEDVVEESEAFKALTESFCVFASSVKDEQTQDQRSLAGFEREFSELLGAWGVSFGLQMTPPTVSDIIKQLINYGCSDQSHNTPVRPDQFGSGFQRHFIYSLISISPKYLEKKKTKKQKDFSPDLTLLLFEEPEAFLHPPQQDLLASSLRRMSVDSTRQVICSTHSSHFVSRNMGDLPSIVRMKRHDGVVKAFQVIESQWEDIVRTNQQINAIAKSDKSLEKKFDAEDLEHEMESVKYCLWMNPDRASAFFSNNVLLVEGPTEQAFITRLISEGKIDVPKSGVYVLDCMGKFNMHRFMSILIRLGTSHAVIYDSDNEKSYHPEIHALIEATADPVLTSCIEKIPSDIETFLGLPKPSSSHRKPQSLMYKYSTGQVDVERLAGLCRLVNRCLRSMH